MKRRKIILNRLGAQKGSDFSLFKTLFECLMDLFFHRHCRNIQSHAF